MFLVDANVLSEATRPTPVPHVIEWLTLHESDLVVTPIVLGEIAYDIRLTPPGRKRTNLQKWFADGVECLNMLPLDAGTAIAWADLLAALKRKRLAMPIKDSLIAASAIQHNLTIATRNIADFKHAGVKLIDPFRT
jgi:hypothetical protein